MNLYCSFCNKSDKEIKFLIAAPSVYICDECVLLCVEILLENGTIHEGTDYYKWAKRKTANA